MKSFKADFRKLTLVCIAIILTISTYIHLPGTYIYFKNFGLKYTDIVHGAFYRLFDSTLLGNPEELGRVWYNGNKFRSLVEGIKLCPIPYIDYKFEHPPIIGGIWYVATCIAIHTVLPQNYDDSTYKYYLDRMAETSYLVNVAFIAVAFTALILYFIKLAELLNLEPKLVFLLLLLPSTILYTTYSWDALAVSLTFIALYLYISYVFLNAGTHYLMISLALFGISIACSIVMIIPTLVVLYELLQLIRIKRFSVKQFIELLAILVLAALTPNIATYAAGSRGFHDLLSYYAQHYCENCLYLPLIQDVFSPLHRVLYTVLITVVMIIVLAIQLKNMELAIHALFLSIASSVVFNYMFKPQTWLLITPLALLSLARNRRLLLLYSIADILNSIIIIAFFNDYELRLLLSRYIHSIPLEQNPLSIHSPIQWIASVRNVILLTVVMSSLFHVHELVKGFSKDYQ